MPSRSLRQLRLVGLLEGTSFLVLLFVAMPLKYAAGLPIAVQITGGHGLLFLVFLLALARTASERRWPRRRVLDALVASILPFGTFVIDRRQWKPELASA